MRESTLSWIGNFEEKMDLSHIYLAVQMTLALEIKSQQVSRDWGCGKRMFTSINVAQNKIDKIPKYVLQSNTYFYNSS